MLKKFAEGLVFGAGFAIAFFVVANFAISSIFSTRLPNEMRAPPSFIEDARQIDTEEAVPFHELAPEEQIEAASVIALARFEPAEDGRMKAVLREFLKMDEGTAIHYKIGDEYRPSSYYPRDDTSHGDGVIIFFTGSPAMMRMSMSYSGDRIHSLGDMPLELFKGMCENAGETMGG